MEIKGKDGKTALNIQEDHQIFEAILTDDFGTLEHIVKTNPKVLSMERNINNELPLGYALYWARLKSADKLKELGANLEGHMKDALYGGADNVASVNWMIANGASVTVQDIALAEQVWNSDKTVPVLQAALERQKAQQMLEIEEKNPPVFDAIDANDFETVEKMVRENPELLNATFSLNDELPLGYACAQGHFDMADRLKELGADVDGHIKEALRFGTQKVPAITWLVENGATVAQKDIAYASLMCKDAVPVLQGALEKQNAVKKAPVFATFQARRER